MSAHILTIKHK